MRTFASWSGHCEGSGLRHYIVYRVSLSLLCQLLAGLAGVDLARAAVQAGGEGRHRTCAR